MQHLSIFQIILTYQSKYFCKSAVIDCKRQFFTNKKNPIAENYRVNLNQNMKNEDDLHFFFFI